MKDYGFNKQGRGRPRSTKSPDELPPKDRIYETEKQRTKRHWDEIAAKRKEPIDSIGRRMLRLQKSKGDGTEADAKDAKKLMVAKNKEKIIEMQIEQGIAKTEHTPVGVVHTSKGGHIRKVWLDHGIFADDLNL